jgi:glutathione S-transferase
MPAMSTTEIVDLETARAARGVRLVVSGIVPSPWSEGAKGVFRLAGIATKWVRSGRPDPALAEWTRAHNVPVVFHDDDPPRTSASDIVALAARLSSAPIVPADAASRAHAFGLLHELAGEDGLGWSGRILMIDAGIRSGGARGFSLPISQYLAPKYGYHADRVAPARARIRDLLSLFERELASSGAEYLAGGAPGALDVYLATFLAPLVGVSEEECPRMRPELRAAFSTVCEDPEIAMPPSLAAHRARMYERHLPLPIQL